jgi:pimeloyl-ACP methyl ester carboxylesterase
MDMYKFSLLSARTALFILFLSSTISSCDSDSPEPEIVPEVLVDADMIASKSKEDIASFVKTTGLPFPASEIKYDVSVYRITYKTTFKDAAIVASALVMLPDTQDDLAMLSFQHGTIAANSEAPSLTSSSASIMNFYGAMATVGFVGVAPDLIGFGASSSILHPYYIEKPTADAITDCLKAARELALVNGRRFNGRLFLAGYSQGGYATMAAHKSIEQNGLENFDLIASFPSSGGYDVKGVQAYFFKQTTYSEPFYIAYVAQAYKTHLGWTQPLTDLFNEPYASKIPGLFNGQNTSGQINTALTTNISDLIQADILVKIDTDPKYDYINDAFEENSLTDWTPKIKMYMYHGDLDITVPYQNSVDVYNKFIQNGASPQVVTFTTLPYGTHSTGVTPYLIKFIGEVMSLKN